jgi:peroxiredoxin Q/BCP
LRKAAVEGGFAAQKQWPDANRPKGVIMKLMRNLVAVLAALLVMNVAAEPLKVGDKAPDFTLKGSDGKTYKLSDFKGKQAVVLAWYPKALTGGCTKECQSLKESGQELRKYDVAYFAASVDDEPLNKQFSDKLQLDFPLLSDPSKDTAKAYGVLNERGMANRWTYYIDKNGKIAYIDQQVKPEGYGQTVTAKLKDLGVGPKK